ncbi:MAG: triosephosphate isomerase [Anaplasma sp.]
MSFLVVANWKMNGDAPLMRDMLAAVGTRFAHGELDGVIEVVICPPFTVLSAFRSSDSFLKLGAQNCNTGKGCTGEISAQMLRECGCDYVILGHSDRRGVFYEKNSDIKLKAEAAAGEGIMPIICVGETLQEKEQGVAREVVLRQCDECIPNSNKFIIAYEPVWAIGGSTTPAIDVIEGLLSTIKSRVPACPILYGGSVNQDNIRALKSGIAGLSGVLVGGAGTKVDTFCGMISSLLEL